MHIHQLYIATLLILQQQLFKNSVQKEQHLQLKVEQLAPNRHYVAVILRGKSNLDIHHSRKFHRLQSIFKTTWKSLTTNLNHREIPLLLIPFRVPQGLRASHVPLCYFRPSYVTLVALMKCQELQTLIISHTRSKSVNRLNTTVSTVLHDW